MTSKGGCGTYGGYQTHKTNKTELCQPCRNAKNAYSSDWKKKNRQKVAAQRALWVEKNPEKAKEIDRKSKAKNKDKCILRVAKWRKNNLLVVKEYSANYYALNSEAIKEKSRNYTKNNPDKIRLNNNKRRARRLKNGFSPYSELDVLLTYGTKCYVCAEEIDLTAPRSTRKKGWEKGIQIDHKTPLALGGRDDLENVRPTHGLCNMKKKTKIDFYAEGLK
jgi:hypothetical protein